MQQTGIVRGIQRSVPPWAPPALAALALVVAALSPLAYGSLLGLWDSIEAADATILLRGGRGSASAAPPFWSAFLSIPARLSEPRLWHLRFGPAAFLAAAAVGWSLVLSRFRMRWAAVLASVFLFATPLLALRIVPAHPEAIEIAMPMLTMASLSAWVFQRAPAVDLEGARPWMPRWTAALVACSIPVSVALAGPLFGGVLPLGFATMLAYRSGVRSRYVRLLLGSASAMLVVTIGFLVARTPARGAYFWAVAGKRSIGSPTWDAPLVDLLYGAFPFGVLAIGLLAGARRDANASQGRGGSRDRHLLLAESLIAVAAATLVLRSLLIPWASDMPRLEAPLGAVASALLVARHVELGSTVRASYFGPVLAAALALGLGARDLHGSPERLLRAALRAEVPSSSWLAPVASASLVTCVGVILSLALLCAFRARWARWVSVGLLVVSPLVLRLVALPRHASAQSAASALGDSASVASHSGAHLAVLGVPTEGLALSGWSPERSLTSTVGGLDWLEGDSRLLLFPADKLAEINAQYRVRHGRNVPLVGNATYATLLASSGAMGSSTNPLDAVVLREPPDGVVCPTEGVDGSLLVSVCGALVEANGQLRALGGGQRLPRRFRLHVYYQVRAALAPHCTFVHIDHSPTRFGSENRDHKTYPMGHWRVGDIVRDTHDVTLAPHFVRGTYPVYAGVGVLPCNDGRRLRIGAHAQDAESRALVGKLVLL